MAGGEETTTYAELPAPSSLIAPRTHWLADDLEATGPPLPFGLQLWASVLRQNFSRRATSRILPAGGTETT